MTMIRPGMGASSGCGCRGMGDDSTTSTTSTSDSTSTTYTQSEVDALVNSAMDLVAGNGQLIAGIPNTYLILGGAGVLALMLMMSRR